MYLSGKWTLFMHAVWKTQNIWMVVGAGGGREMRTVPLSTTQGIDVLNVTLWGSDQSWCMIKQRFALCHYVVDQRRCWHPARIRGEHRDREGGKRLCDWNTENVVANANNQKRINIFDIPLATRNVLFHVNAIHFDVINRIYVTILFRSDTKNQR